MIRVRIHAGHFVLCLKKCGSKDQGVDGLIEVARLIDQ